LPQRALLRQELPFDFHTGFAETSLALYYAPQSVTPRYQKLGQDHRFGPNVKKKG
jgi:hypothetical protein